MAALEDNNASTLNFTVVDEVNIHSTTYIESIQCQLDNHINDMSAEWKASIPFCCHVILDHNNTTQIPKVNDPSVIDICDYLGGLKYPAIRLNFCHITYPPPTSNEEMASNKGHHQCTGWTDLSRDLAVAAHGAGHSIICNGSQKSNNNSKNNRVFRCGSFHRATRTTAMDITDECQYRQTCLINDRKKNNRKNGQSFPKRIKTVDMRGCTCRFQFMVKWDTGLCFYIELQQRSGHPYHSSHLKLLSDTSIPLPTRLLTSDQVEETLHVINATSNNGAARNYLHGKFGKFVNLIKIAYLQRRETGVLDSTKDDIDNMLENFESSNEISFVSLSDVPVKDYFEAVDNYNDIGSINDIETITVTTTKGFSGGIQYREMKDNPETICLSHQISEERCERNDIGSINDIETITVTTTKGFSGGIQYREMKDNPETICLSHQISEERCERNMKKEDALFIAVAWIVKPAFRLFKLCPEVVWLDVTSHSNNKGFHLLTFSSRLSIGKQIVWMWIFVPNQQRFSFRWVFQEAIPTLLPKWLRDRVLFFMKDGDPQQRNEILFSFMHQFVNAKEGTCGFHVVHMGWKKNVPSCTNISLSPTKINQWSIIVSTIHQWIYSWMNPGNVEDKEEYKLSKYLLEKYICSKTVLDAIDGNTWIIGRILKFLRCHVYTWETLYLHYERKQIRHYDTSHSSPHEGTNHGLKSHSAGVKATMNLDLSAKTLNTQTNLRVAECDDIIYQEATHTHKKWSSLPTSQFTVTVAEGIIQAMMSRRCEYSAKLVSRKESTSVFQVSYNNHVEIDTDGMQKVTVIPRFLRIRTVTVDEDDTMFCTCNHFERLGLPCVHQACVATMCYECQDTHMDHGPFKGFTHHDISVRWWSSYLYYGYKASTPSAIVQNFHTLAVKDVRGPKLRCQKIDSMSSMGILESDPYLPAIDRLKNYCKDDICVEEFNDCILSHSRIHLSQTDADESTDCLLDGMAKKLQDKSGAHLNDMFSKSIMNYDFDNDKEHSIKARYSLKQLWEESCAEADNIGDEGVK